MLDTQTRAKEIYTDAADALRDLADMEINEIAGTNTQLNAELLDVMANHPWGGSEVISELRTLLGHYETPGNEAQ
jgi:hypothetical protein